MVVYVFTLGFHADHVIRRLSRARDVEAIHIFTGRPAARAVYNAFQEVVAFCEKASFPVPKLYEIPVDDSGLAVYMVLSVLKGCSHIVADVGGGLRGVVVSVLLALVLLSRWSFVEVYVYGEREDASGGMRVHCLALLVLALNLSQRYRVEFYVGLESGQKLFKLPLPQIANLLRLTDSKLRLLQLVADLGEATVQGIAKALNKDVSYVRKAVKALVSEGLLEQVGSRPPRFRVTEVGRLTLKLQKLVV